MRSHLVAKTDLTINRSLGTDTLIYVCLRLKSFVVGIMSEEHSASVFTCWSDSHNDTCPLSN